MTPNYSAVLDFDYQLRRHVRKRNRAMFEQNIFHFSDFFLDKIDFNLDKIDVNLDKIDFFSFIFLFFSFFRLFFSIKSTLLRFRSHGLLLSNNYSQSPTKQLNKSGST